MVTLRPMAGEVLRLARAEESGDIYAVRRNGELAMFDADGYIRSAQPVESPHACLPDDDELFYVRQRCERMEERAARVANGERLSAADARQLEECAASVRLLVERAEARGQVH